MSDIYRRLGQAVLVYGTVRDAGANRYAAEQLQQRYLDQYESQVPIYKDFEVSDDLLRHRDVIFVGRPEANSALAAWSESLSLDYQGACFRVAGKAHASEREALLLAGKNPLDAAHMVLVIAGNDALRTVKASGRVGRGGRVRRVRIGQADKGRNSARVRNRALAAQEVNSGRARAHQPGCAWKGPRCLSAVLARIHPSWWRGSRWERIICMCPRIGSEWQC